MSPPDPLVPLLAAAADGDEGAFEELYRSTSARAFGLAVRMVRDRAVAEEVVLDAYAQLWRKARQYDAGRGPVIAWILLLVRSRAIDRLRFEALPTRAMLPVDEVAGERADAALDPEASTLETERAQRVRAALATLPREQRVAIEAAFFGGLSHSEVAAALDAPLGTVKTRIRTGLLTLRRLLAEPLGDLVS
ncbi:MAG: sigma-70 family RNA polymerase sigma factor [Thermoanaerobaculia bacterium]